MAKKIELTNSQISEIKELYHSGLSCQKIANKLNFSESFISKKLKS